MNNLKQQNQALASLTNELQHFLALSFQGNDQSMHEWITESVTPLSTHCWQIKKCHKTACPAFKSQAGRCWLIAGTMCGGEVQGKFADKYDSCTECEVYSQAIGNDPVSRLRELIIALIHSLRLREAELKETRTELKVLSGLLPICMTCKKIRDDEGDWIQMETYIHKNSEARFTHGICPHCIEQHYPGVIKPRNNTSAK